jgi:hypothetical protein
LPYLRCPNCTLLVYKPGDQAANALCPRCGVRTYEETRHPPREELYRLMGSSAEPTFRPPQRPR